MTPFPLPSFVGSDASGNAGTIGTISYVDSTTGGVSNSASCTMTQPAGILAGDLGIFTVGSGSGTLTTPTGWTAQVSNGLYYRIYDGTEGSISLAFSTTTGHYYALSVFRGAKATAPIHQYVATTTAAGASSMAGASQTPTAANTAVVSVARLTSASSGTQAIGQATSGFTTRVVRPAPATIELGIASATGPALGSPSTACTWTVGTGTTLGTTGTVYSLLLAPAGS